MGLRRKLSLVCEKLLKRSNSMADKLSAKQLKEFKETFKMFDKNGNGTINSKELASLMRSFGMKPSPKEIEDMIKELDADMSGFIDFDEFMKLMTGKVSRKDSKKQLMQSFQTFDKNKDGFIVRSEFKSVMKKHGEKLSGHEIDKMIRESDLDHDGKINYIEFVKMMR